MYNRPESRLIIIFILIYHNLIPRVIIPLSPFMSQQSHSIRKGVHCSSTLVATIPLSESVVRHRPRRARLIVHRRSPLSVLALIWNIRPPSMPSAVRRRRCAPLPSPSSVRRHCRPQVLFVVVAAVIYLLIVILW
jgi:hypothetical protein